MKNLLSGQENRVEVESAGVHVFFGLTPDKFTKKVCFDHGMDVSSHEPRQLTKEMIDQSDVVLCLAENHQQTILSAYPRLEPKVFLLKKFRQERDVQNPSVDDPIGKPLEHYEHCFEEIEEEVKRIAPLLIHEEP